jgi:hypothetical protein
MSMRPFIKVKLQAVNCAAFLLVAILPWLRLHKRRSRNRARNKGG